MSGCFAWVGAGADQACRSVSNGERIILQAPEHGCRSYLAMPGGVRAESSEIRKGSVLLAGDERPPARTRRLEGYSVGKTAPIRIIKGPNAGLLDWESFSHGSLVCTHEMDRMGIRLSATPAPKHDIELVSEPSVVGTIQIPPSGHPIVLGPDGPTIGGYPKIAVLPEFELHRIGQLRPGETVELAEVDLTEARDIGRQWRQALSRRWRLSTATA